jgi:hypothetical protein
MIQKLAVVLAILALVASAGTVPVGNTYRITLVQPSVVKDTVLKPGDYKVNIGDSKVTITPANGKSPVEAAVKIETVEKKFSDTVIGYTADNGKSIITEIRFGGTTTRVLFAR